jgi:N-acetylglucosaminyl-diphospho-decaprenol L-rhamnosyltransferase
MTPSPRLSAIFVHHRQPALAAACVGTFRAAAAGDGLASEIVLVDCGSPAADRSALDVVAADVRVDLPDNRGYSGGVNAGMARARGAVLLLSNVDVEYRPGSLAPLVAAAEQAGVGAAAPVCAWDAGDRLFLPPGFDPGFLEELSLLRSGRSPSRDDRRFADFAREAVRLWIRGGPARHLSGAVLAARREVFDRVGRFDERFPFEYEETEWERRVRGAELRLEVVATSRVRHAWRARDAGTSAAAAGGTEPANSDVASDRERRRRESRRRWREERFGRIGRALLERAERRPPPAAPPGPRLDFRDLPARPGAWLALSPHRSRIPFVGADLSRPFAVPPEVRPVLASGEWIATIFAAADGRPLEGPALLDARRA